MNEGVIEGSENAGHAEDEFTWEISETIRVMLTSGLPSLTWGPREIFSCAGRTTFLGGMVVAGIEVAIQQGFLVEIF